MSRNHCQIHYSNGRFRLSDTLSKFGTLSLIQGRLEITPDTVTGTQIGRTMIIFQTKEHAIKDPELGFSLRAKEKAARKHIDEKVQEKKEKRMAAIKEYEDKKKNKKYMNQREEAKKLGLDEFDYDQYLDHLAANQLVQEALIEQQQEEHRKLLEFQQ